MTAQAMSLIWISIASAAVVCVGTIFRYTIRHRIRTEKQKQVEQAMLRGSR
jgi:hypothetical protein